MNLSFTDKELARAKKYTTVIDVVPGSIAEELGVVPGDCLVAINGEIIRDIFDYRMRISEEKFNMTFFLHDDGYQTVEIERDLDEEVGLVFDDEEPLLDKGMSCHSNCIFCFIAQLPKNMRETLYFKDDDIRMSFLTGNYVTLTNLKDEEFDRMLSYRLSPINVSVHTTNPQLRCDMLNNRFAGNIMERLRKIADLGLEINCQFVLCPGINDGEELDRSLRDLYSLGETVKSIACVPVGLTRFREQNNLPKLARYDENTASAVLEIVNKWQKIFLEERGSRVFYAADEFYIRAKRDMPNASEYEDYPQLENGVGMVADFIDMMDCSLSSREQYVGDEKPYTKQNNRTIWEITGTDAYEYVRRFEGRLSELYNLNYVVKPVVNDFFGDTITVTGLLVGGDIARAMEREFNERGKPSLIVISKNMLKADEDIFLDNMTLEELKRRLQVEIYVKKDVDSYLEYLDERFGRRGETT